MFPNTVTESLSENLIRQACQLSPEERAELFIQYVQKAQQVWLLQGDAGFVMVEHGDSVCLPVWPHQDLAKAWSLSSQQPARQISVELSTFVQTWLPGLMANQTELLIFPAGPATDALALDGDEVTKALSGEGED
ncbi:DUF2750 domain-containing protein [Alteromonas aestuariivivens]|uniref:DUF2750 domain-containing protein n=1 Tax=Alteromonas aestuariivivens TaxID=1938339 RepID=UPI0015F249F8|nr:DUF2750 domain-containing protein [Alteromonas aestuariivivens]